MSKLFPIGNEEQEMCVLCILGIGRYEYMPESAQKLYDSLTEKDKQEVMNKLGHLVID